MFCPAGYHSALELWHEFVSVRLEETYGKAVEGYNAPDFQAGFSRGSPLDICEHIFLVSLAAIGVHVASPTGDVMRLHVKMGDGKPSLFSTTGMYSALMYDAASAFGSQSGNQLGFLENAGFKAWEHEPDDNEALSRHYLKFEELDESTKRDPMLELFHHTLFHHIIRNTYIISDSIPMWATTTSTAVEVAPLLENFSGWSICVDEKTYRGEWQDYLSGRKQVYSALQMEEKAKGVGRPKLDAARAVFEAMGFEKGSMSWEALARKIEYETGVKPSHKALRNWRNEHQKED